MRLLIVMLSVISLVSVVAYAEQDHSYDPFRDQFFQLKFNPPKPPKNNPNPIPKIVHQFWIGKHPLPDPYSYMMHTCQQLDGFEYKLWTNLDYESLLSTPEYKAIYASIPDEHIAIKKDFLSYLALEHFGGVVLDASMMCVHNPGKLHDSYSYYAMYPYGKLASFTSDSVYLLHAGVIGAAKNSPIIQDVIKRFKEFIGNYREYNKKYTAPSFKNKEEFHGWMGQVVMNEAVYHYCFIDRPGCNDVRILGKEWYSFGGEQVNSEKEALFVDGDLIPTGMIIKSLYRRVDTVEHILDILKRTIVSYGTCTDLKE